MLSAKKYINLNFTTPYNGSCITGRTNKLALWVYHISCGYCFLRYDTQRKSSDLEYLEIEELTDCQNVTSNFRTYNFLGLLMNT